jgi:hypothetical protein
MQEPAVAVQVEMPPLAFIHHTLTAISFSSQVRGGALLDIGMSAFISARLCKADAGLAASPAWGTC